MRYCYQDPIARKSRELRNERNPNANLAAAQNARRYDGQSTDSCLAYQSDGNPTAPRYP